MSKEYLEAWNFIKDQMPYFTHSHLVTEMSENSDIVEQALQRLEQIDNSKPSEALKEFNKLKERYEKIPLFNWFTIKQALITKSKKELSFDVIKEALKNGIYVKDLPSQEKLKFYDNLKLSSVETEIYLTNNKDLCVNVNDYGISFWLKGDLYEKIRN